MENNIEKNEVKEQQVAVQVENKGSKKKALIVGGVVVALLASVGTAAYFHWAKKTKTDEFEECK